MAESTNLTILTPPSFITDAGGGVWGFVPSPKGMQICYNGIVQTNTTNAAFLLYFNHTVYYQNNASKWYMYKTVWTATTDPRVVVVTESPNGTTITTVGPAIIDSSLESWKLTNGQQISVNGVVDISTALVTLLYYRNHILYQQNSAGGWWSKTKASDPWTLTTDPRSTPSTESADGTSVTTIGPAIINSSLESWTLVAGTNGMQIAVNSKTDTTTAMVVLLYYTKHTLYQQNSAGGWWSKTKSTDAWTGTTDPRGAVQTFTGITLSNSRIASGAPSGTVVGSIAVALSMGTFSGVLSLSGANATSFMLAGNNLVTKSVVSAGSYSINIVATQAGTVGSPYTKSFSITANGGSVVVPRPPGASQHGANFANLVFNEDFTNPATITTSFGSTKGFNFYPFWQDQNAPTNFEHFPNMLASQVTNGNRSSDPGGIGGPKASPGGGVFKINGIAPPNGVWVNSNWATAPQDRGVVGQAWKHMYIESYVQFDAGGTSGDGFPAVWSWSIPPTNGLVEIDFMEYGFYGQGSNPHQSKGYNTSDPGGNPGGAARSGGAITNPTNDSGWHTHGMLWVPGHCYFYYDDVEIGNSTTGPGGQIPDLENTSGLPMIFGTGRGWPMYIDWVRVWQ